MGQVFKIVRENKLMDELLTTLTEQKEDIKELVCIVRYRNGDINTLDSDATFETLCSGSKLLDYLITSMLDIDNLELEITEDLIDEDES